MDEHNSDDPKKMQGDMTRLHSQFLSASKQVRELGEFIEIMINLSPFGICIFQRNKMIFTNKTLCDILGKTSRELRHSDPISLVLADDREHVQKSMRPMLLGRSESYIMFRVLTDDEKMKWILASFALIHMNGQRAVWGSFVDLTEGKVMQLAYSDPLTGLPNRMLLLDRLEQAIVSAKRRDATLAVMYIDLDGFKHVNDSFGHDIGDKLLVEIAARMREVVRRENDTIARMGGDEFLILLTDILDRKHIDLLLALLFEKFAEPITVGDPPRDIQVAFSVGVSFFPDDGSDPEALINAADQAMYSVKKEHGKNSFRFYQPDKTD